MKLENLITENNQLLYNSVRETYKIHLKRNKDGKFWGCNITSNSIVEIHHCKTENKIESFTHELLHASTQINGYRRFRGAISLNLEFHTKLPRIISCLDNELQHHKMFDKFLEMGFQAENFYNDSDSEIEEYLINVLSENNLSFEDLFPDYMSLIAPGGTLTYDQIEKLKLSFKEYDGSIYESKFIQIDQIISDWVADNNFDAETYIIRIFNILTNSPVWITYDNTINGLNENNFPINGFFTNEEFSIPEIQNAFQGYRR